MAQAAHRQMSAERRCTVVYADMCMCIVPSLLYNYHLSELIAMTAQQYQEFMFLQGTALRKCSSRLLDLTNVFYRYNPPPNVIVGSVRTAGNEGERGGQRGPIHFNKLFNFELDIHLFLR